MRPDELTKLTRRAFDSLGIPNKYHFHTLRHTHISYLLKEGTPLKVVQERAGHTSSSTTLDVYAHVLEGQDEAAAGAFESAMAEVREKHFTQILPNSEAAKDKTAGQAIVKG